MTLKERVEEYCKHARIRISAFERHAGLSNGYFNQVKKEPSPSKLSQIETAFPDLNTDWLLTGKGFMLKTTDQPVSQGGEDVTPTKAELNNPKTMERLFELIKDQQRQTRELSADLREERLNRKEEVSRFLSLIEKMQGIAGAESAAQKKRRSGILISLIPSPLERKKYDKIKPSKISSI